MATIKWDAYRSLSIINRDSRSMTCVGRTIYGKRCRWNIPNNRVLQARRILDDFEAKAPEKATGSLKLLARLCLCEEYHQEQCFEIIDEWKAAIEEATQFYEKGQNQRDTIRDLKKLLTEEMRQRSVLKKKFEAETSRRQQDVNSIGAMSQEVLLLRTKLEKAEKEAKNSKEYAQKWSEAYDERISDTAKRISTIQAACNEEKKEMATTLEREREKAIGAINLELERAEIRQKSLVKQVSKLTRRLDHKLLENSELQSKLSQAESEQALTLSQRDEFKSQLEVAAEKTAQIGHSLQEAETARDVFSEDAQRLQARLNIEEQNIKTFSDANAQLEQTNADLVQEVSTLSAKLSSEHHTSAELHLALQTAGDNLSRVQTQHKIVKEELSRSKNELEKIQVESARIREDAEKEHRRLSLQQEASLARIEDLVQEIAYANNHPFRIFILNLLGSTAGWAKSVIARFGSMRTRKLFDPLNMGENMPSP